MEWVEPQHQTPAVDRAGQVLRNPSRFALTAVVDAVQVLDNWRASHAFPLNTFQVVLRNRAREIDPSALIAQRLKRVPSVLKKLSDRRTMRLSQMQDIGGCRAVVRTLSQLGQLQELYLARRSANQLVGSKDYVAEPRDSGYRSIHLIYRYQSGRSAKRAVFNGHLIELQLRTQVQHAWATTVETVGTVISQALKSNEGPAEWLSLLRHVSSLFAYFEGTPPVEGALAPRRLASLVRREARRLRMQERLQAFGNALQLLETGRSRDDRYFLLRLDPAAEQLEIHSYRAGEIEEATKHYNEIEKAAVDELGVDVVLVRAESLDALRRAYPNYFLDTQFFLSLLEELTTGVSPRLGRGRLRRSRA
jgi:hypothetical protein